MEAIPEPLFRPGDRVIQRSDRSKVGIVVGEPRRSGAIYWYRVEFADGTVFTIPENDLERYHGSRSPADLFRSGSFGDRDDFLRLVTFQKLDAPLDNTLYALRGSRTAFYPHQYKPLVKFLRNREQRLLIADEVGLGKTIEAGFVLIELRARNSLRQCLIVCPAALTLKWREEMWRRFEEEFRILDSKEFSGLLRDLNERGDLGEFRYIISLQSLRQEQHIDGLEANPLPISLLIVDEAHHCRNPSTNSARVVSALAEPSDAVLLLTATPIHLGTQNLFQLFNILEPGEFDSYETFQQRLEANRPLVEAQQLLSREFPPPLEEVRERVTTLTRRGYAAYFENNPLYERVRSTILDFRDPSRRQVAELQQDLEDLNLIGRVFTRTRKREVFENPPVRTPWVRKPEMNAAEEEFYQAVTEFVRESAARKLGGTLRYFAVMAAQRQVASCMHAVKERFVREAEDVFAAHDIEDSDFADWADTESEEGEEFEIVPPSLRVIRAAHALGEEDTKYEALKALLRDLDEAEPNRKIILFAYYRATLHYLMRRLTEDGFSCELIHGGIPSDPTNPDQDERGRRVARFRDDLGVRLLLSSEVSSEGLDFQFCHILINYDLPWNPMRVEQRIGRLDRIGQRSDRIIIANFSIPGTIEEKILGRLYERIGIFEASIGDLEQILGDEIQKLTIDLLSRRLTPEEEDERIGQAAGVIERRKAELARLEAETPQLVGHDAYLREELERIQAGGEFLSPEDCELFFRRFLKRYASKSEVRPARAKGVYHLSVAHDLQSALQRQPESLARRRFFQRLGSGEIDITFSSDVAYEDEHVEFVRAHHPLMRAAVKAYHEDPAALHPVSALQLETADGMDPGVYYYALYDVRITGGRERRRLVPFIMKLSTKREHRSLEPEDCSLLLGDMLRKARSWETALGSLPENATEEIVGEAENRFLDRIAREREDMEARNQARVKQRLVSLDSTFQAALRKKRDLLQKARERRRDPRYIRMLEGTIRNMKRDHNERRRGIEEETELRFKHRLAACGLLRVN